MARAAGSKVAGTKTRPEDIGNVTGRARRTGEEYLESLRDGREVYIYGERVKDVTTHPAFRNTARMVARLYDALHDDKRSKKILLPTDTGNGGMTHAFFKAPKTLDDLLAGRDAIAEWARITYGWIGRSPDYKAAFLATLGANADFYDPYQENAKRWYKFSQERVPFINHAIIHPPVDRDRPPNEVADVCAHVEKETDAGIIVSGAKVVATGSVLTNYTFVAHHGLIPLQDKNFAVVFMVPTNAPGVKFICRTSYEMTSTVMGSPFDYPLSLAARRERRRVHHGQGAGALGERLRLRRHREGQQLLPAHRLPAALRRARLHAARGEARLHRRPAAQGGGGVRHQGLSRRAGQCRRGDRLAQPVLGAVRRHGARSEARGSATTCCPTWIRATPTRSSRPWPTRRSNTSSSRRWRRASSTSTATRATSRTRRSGPISTATCAAPTATRPRSASS